MKIPNHVSESVKRLNPQVFNGGVVKVGGEERKQDPQPTLGADLQGKQTHTQPVVEGVYKVTFVSFRKRLQDSDNSQSGGQKALRDAVSRSLNVDDGDTKRITFRYEQIKVDSKEEEGTLVKIDTYEKTL